MVHFSKKRIKGKDYLYAVKSIRLPDGKIIKLAKRVDKESDASKLAVYFEAKEEDARVKYSKNSLKKVKLRDPKAIEKMEEMKLDYRRIIRQMTPAQLKDLFDRFTVNFTYESNALEGNSLTLKEVAIVIFEKSIMKGKELREIYETRNSREVVDLILRKKFGVKETDILKMHKMLIKDMGIMPGYKKLPNYLHGREIIASSPENARKELLHLLDWYGKNEQKMHPLVLASNLHGRFEEIHPFEDGNGRVGRFLIDVILIDSGYPPLIIRKTQRIAYFNALADFDNGRPQTLDNFLFKCLVETFEKFFKVYAKYLK